MKRYSSDLDNSLCNELIQFGGLVPEDDVEHEASPEY